MNAFETVKALCGADGPSGFEGEAAQRAAELLRPLMDEVRVDPMGNVVGLRCCGKTGAKRLLLDAHLDEIGFLVTGIEEGFLRFQSIGGVDPRMLPGRELTILTQPPRFGVVASKPPHLQGPGEGDQAVPLEELRIDVGLSQEEAQRLIPIGTPAVYRSPAFPLGEGQVCGKAMDDRACFAILLRTAELLREKELDVDLYILGSVFEETGGVGAETGAFSIMPDLCVAVDVTFGATPDSPRHKTMKLDGGPAIGVGTCISKRMSSRLEQLAKEHDIPFQREIMAGTTGTNGDSFQIAREGIPTAVVSLPEKYMHTPVEAVSLADMEHTARLLAAFVLDCGKEGHPC